MNLEEHVRGEVMRALAALEAEKFKVSSKSIGFTDDQIARMATSSGFVEKFVSSLVDTVMSGDLDILDAAYEPYLGLLDEAIEEIRGAIRRAA